MRKLTLMLALILCLLQAGLPCASAGYEAAEEDAPFDGYLLGLAPGAETPEGTREVLPGVVRTDDYDLACALLADGSAEYAEPNAEARLFDSETKDDGWVYDAQEGEFAAALGLTGEGVRIALIDSGVDAENDDLLCAKIAPGYDYLEGRAAPMLDDVGHGTQVAQMLAADRNEKGGTGLARGAELVPLRCFSGKKTATLDVLARAIRDAADRFSCDIINMSWGVDVRSQTLYDALRYAYDKGCILVAAAGNVTDSDPQGTVFYPAAYDEVIGVGALTRTGEISGCSQQTAAVCICAPGERVPGWRGGRAYVSTGTSFAAPCVSALLALAKERLPSLDGAGAMRLVRDRAVDRGAAGYDSAYGFGALNARALLEKDWCDCRQEGGDAVLSGWITYPQDCRSVAALYEDSGRMTACAFLALGEKGGFTRTLSGVTRAPECRLFRLDADLRPAREK